MAEPEAILFNRSFMDLLAGHPKETQAVVRLTIEGCQDTEIADAQ